jgi:hypothetical protein
VELVETADVLAQTVEMKLPLAGGTLPGSSKLIK